MFISDNVATPTPTPTVSPTITPTITLTQTITVLDTKGPEVRTGEIEGEPIILEDNKTIEFTKKIISGNKDIVTINYKTRNTHGDLIDEVADSSKRFVIYNIEYGRNEDGPDMTIYVSEVS